jgi:3-oxoacyl-[acyl-carrier-protein] synthase II
VDGHCGIVSIKDRSPVFATLPSQVAALVPEGSRKDGKWDAKEYGLNAGVGDAQQQCNAVADVS